MADPPNALLWHADAIARHAQLQAVQLLQLQQQLRDSEAANFNLRARNASLRTKLRNVEAARQTSRRWQQRASRAVECFDSLYAELHLAWAAHDAQRRKAEGMQRLYERALRERVCERVETQRVVFKHQGVADELSRRLMAEVQRRCAAGKASGEDVQQRADKPLTHADKAAEGPTLQTEAVTPTKGNSQDSWSGDFAVE